MNLGDPYSKEELQKAVITLKFHLKDAFDSITEDLFFNKPETGWSLAENVQHINRVTKLLGLSFSTPKFISSLIFGESKLQARRMREVADIYLAALAKGQNSGPFSPKTEKAEGNLTDRKNKLLSDWNKYWEQYALAIDSWSEEQLDKILMLHPFLGKIPAREMYIIGLLHPVHHSMIVSKRFKKEWKYF